MSPYIGSSNETGVTKGWTQFFRPKANQGSSSSNLIAENSALNLEQELMKPAELQIPGRCSTPLQCTDAEAMIPYVLTERGI